MHLSGTQYRITIPRHSSGILHQFHTKSDFAIYWQIMYRILTCTDKAITQAMVAVDVHAIHLLYFDGIDAKEARKLFLCQMIADVWRENEL